MRISLRAKTGTVPDSLKQYVERKLQKLERYFHHIEGVEVVQTTERGQHIVELTIQGDGVVLRSEERCPDLNAAVDNAVEKMERQVIRFKTRVRRSHQRPGPVKELATDLASADASSDAPDDDEPRPLRIARRKQFSMKPMSAEEAARQMELTDHTFFLFHNEETGTVNVIYRRHNGDYGLIEPE